MKFDYTNSIQWTAHGDWYERAKATYKGFVVYETYRSPGNPFKKATCWYLVDLNVPCDYPMPVGRLIDIYNPEGFLSPCFDTPEDVISFLDNYINN